MVQKLIRMFSRAAMMLAVMLCCLTAAKAQEAYAVLSDDYSVLTFYYDNQKANRNGMDVGPFTCTWDDDRVNYTISSGWYEHRESITSVVFDDSFAGCTTLTSTAWWFFELENLTAITGISNSRYKL